MQPTPVAEPFHREAWVYEEKYDGWRMVAYKAGQRVRLASRNGRDHTDRTCIRRPFDAARKPLQCLSEARPAIRRCG